MIDKVIPLTNFEPFSGLTLLLTFWQGDTFDQFWTFFWACIIFSGLILLLTIWQGDTFDQFWIFFWTFITFDYLVEVWKEFDYYYAYLL